MVSLDNIAQFLDQFFAVHRFGNDQNGAYLPSTRLVTRLGLALEPWAGLTEWARAEQLDALFLHRPWQLQSGQLAADVGVVAYHLAFDEHLTLGFNPRLAAALGMSKLEILGEKQGRVIGMIGDVPTQSFASFCCCVNEVFDGQEQARTGNKSEVSRVAVVGAMNDALVLEAASRGATAYITGQLRPTQYAALLEEISVIGVGHRRCEEWGLRALAGVLCERWSSLEVVVAS